MDYSGGFSLSGLLIARGHELSQRDFSIDEALRPRRFFRTDREPLQSDVRRRYDFLFDLIQNAGLRISEALAVKVRDVRLANCIAKSVRMIRKGNKERLAPFPEAFGQVFGYWGSLPRTENISR